MPILKKLPRYVHFKDEKGIIQQQGIEFEWKPTICEKCKKYGYEAEQCKKEDGPMEWRPKTIQPGARITQQPTQQEWIQVSRNRDPQISQASGQVLTPINNCFEYYKRLTLPGCGYAYEWDYKNGGYIHSKWIT